MNNTKFQNYWLDLEEEDKLKTSFVISRRHAALLSSVHGKTGTLQTTITILLDKLHNELTKHGLTSYDPATFERAVSECRIQLGHLLQRSPVEQRAAGTNITQPIEATGGDDATGATIMARESTGTPQSSDATSAPRSRRRKTS